MLGTCGDLIAFVENGTYHRTKGQCVQVISHVVGNDWEGVPLDDINMRQAEKRFTNAFLKEGYAPTTTKSYFSAFRTRRREYEDAMQFASLQSQSPDGLSTAKRLDASERVGSPVGAASSWDIPLRLSTGPGVLSIPTTLTEADVERIHDIALHYVA